MKDGLIIVGFAVVAIVVGVWLIFFGKNTVPTANPTTNSNLTAAAVNVPYNTLASGMHASVASRTNYLITSQSQLDSLWKLLGATSTPPQIDFNQNLVAAVFAGTEPTTGYQIQVSRVTDSADRTVHITLDAPGPHCQVAQQQTTPFEVVEVPQTNLSFAHAYQFATSTCQ